VPKLSLRPVVLTVVLLRVIVVDDVVVVVVTLLNAGVPRSQKGGGRVVAPLLVDGCLS
jgi:hypothetical protein